MKLSELSYKVTGKFKNDHTIAAPNLSKTTSIDSAVKRYKEQPNVLLSSWILVDDSTLQNKAKDAKKVACVYQTNQHMALAIKVKRRTVTISAFTKDEIRGTAERDYIKVAIAAGERYLDCKSEEKDVTLCVKGPWDPLTGEVQLYHYEEGDMPAAAMVDKYLEWFVNERNVPIRPVCTK